MRSSWDRGYFLSTVERSVGLTVSAVKGKSRGVGGACSQWKSELLASKRGVRNANLLGMLRRTLFIPGPDVLFLLMALTLTGLFFYAATRR